MCFIRPVGRYLPNRKFVVSGFFSFVLERMILLNKEVLHWVSSFLKNIIMYSLQEAMGLIMTFLFMYTT